MLIPTVLSIDTNLGRFDYNSLSEQTLMELLIDGLTEKSKRKYQDSNGMYLDVCDWKGLSFDKDGNVTAIELCGTFGSIQVAFLPPKVTRFDLYSAHVKGSIDTHSLPDELQAMFISEIGFHGTVDFQRIPRKVLNLGIAINRFTGTADLQNLPPNIEGLWMQENNFSGDLNLKTLPATLKYLNISKNAFSGEFCLEHAPEGLRYLDAQENNFELIAVVPIHVNCVRLRGSFVESIVDAAGNIHPEAYMIGNADLITGFWRVS